MVPHGPSGTVTRGNGLRLMSRAGDGMQEVRARFC